MEVRTEDTVERNPIAPREPETGATPVVCDVVLFCPSHRLVTASEWSPGTKAHAHNLSVEQTTLELLFLPSTKSFFVRRYGATGAASISTTSPKGHTDAVVMAYVRMAAGLVTKQFSPVVRYHFPGSGLPAPEIVVRANWTRPVKDGLW